MKYEGQTFGKRLVIRDFCVDEDWESVGLRVPTRKDKYVFTKCLNCGKELPCMKRNLLGYPPKRCVFCSNIGNHSKVAVGTNTWAVYDDYAVCNVVFKGKTISFYIDSNDYKEISSYTWRISQKRQKFYVICGSKKKGTMCYLHRKLIKEVGSQEEIDHIDGNSLNNRRSNLRIVDKQENIDNQRATRIDNQIGIRGVYPRNNENKFGVDFSYHGKRYYPGSWKTIEEAVWCRYCFEKYFGIPAIENNPLAKEYFTLENDDKEKIQQYVLGIILGNER